MTLSPALRQQVAAIQAELDAKDARIQSDALSRYKALALLEGHVAARQELHEAGVSEERVLALYPFGMEQVIHAVIAAIEQRGLGHLNGTEAWARLDEFNYEAKTSLPRDVQDQMVDDFMSALRPDGHYTLLGKVVRDHIQGIDASERANGVHRALLYACWMMTHLSQVPGRKRHDVMNYFSLVMQWVFPDMTAETL